MLTCDERHTTPLKAMQQIAADLAAQGLRHAPFDERLRRYQQLREEVERDQGMPRSALSLMARGLSEQTARSLREPYSPAFEDIAAQTADETLDLLTSSVHSRWPSEEARLLRDPESLLTPLLVELLTQVCRQRPLVLMFDVFEHTGDALSAWLRALFSFEYGEFDQRLCFVLAGREQLGQYWNEFDDVLCRMPLEPFTLDETRQYLANKQITDEKLVEQIHSASGGLPALLELLAATRPQFGQDLPDISEDAVKRFLHWTPEPERRRAALLAAVPRQFNRDILAALLGRSSEADADADFAWLNAQSYIRSSAERGRFYHDRVRELMLRYLRNTSPAELESTHRRLADHFTAQQERLGLEGKAAYASVEWRCLECERVYHTVSTQPEAQINVAVNTFFMVLRWGWYLFEDVSHICYQISQETGINSIKEVATRLMLIYQESKQEKIEEVLRGLYYFEKVCNLDVYVKSFIYTLICLFNAANNKEKDALSGINQAIVIDPSNALAIAVRGMVYESMGRHEEALVDFDKAISLDVGDALLITIRGEMYRITERYDDALMDFGRAIEIDPDNSWAFANRGKTYQMMKRYEEALVDFGRAIEIDKNDTSTIYERGKTYKLMKRYEKALEDFSRLIDLDSSISGRFNDRGRIYLLMGRYEEALLDFNQAIEIDGNSAWAMACRGQTYRAMKRYEEALMDFDWAIKLDPSSSWRFTDRAETYGLIGRYEEALVDFGQAMELESNNYWIFIGRSKIYRLLKRYEEALIDLDRAIELEPNSSWIFTQRGEICRLLKYYERALANFGRAIELDPNSSWRFFERGEMYKSMRRYEEALADFNRVIELDENNSWWFTERAEIHLLMSRYEEALADFGRAMELGPNSPWVITEHGIIYMLMGKYEEALADFNRVMAMIENHTGAISERAETYRRMGLFEQAIADFTQALSIDGPTTFCLHRRAACYRALGSEDAAQADLAQVFELPLEDGSDYCNRGVACVLLGRHEEAIELLRQAFAMDDYERVYSLTDDLLDPLRDRPDFQALLAAPPGPPAEPAV